MRLLSQTENGRSNFFICFDSPSGQTAQAKKNQKKIRAHGFLGPAVKTAEITTRPVWDLKWPKFKNLFFSCPLPLYGLTMFEL